MASDEKQCPDCKTPMTRGFILDLTYGGRMVPRWIKGEPETSMWTGVKTSGKECRTVESYRCEECGLLRSYAVEEASPPGTFSN